MKSHISMWCGLALVVCVATGANAKDFDVRAYGAAGDGRTKDTAALQKAIDECADFGGGRVVLEKGTYLTGTLLLKSGVELHLDVTATLLGSPDSADYPERAWKHMDAKRLPRGRGAALIAADQAVNVAITGRGTIDGNGMAFVRKRATLDGYTRLYCPYERDPDHLGPPRLIFLAGCRNALFTDFTVVNSPSGWTFYLNDCDLAHFDRVNILAGLQAPNIDGIHLNCCRDVMVSNCRIETQDDSIVLRGDDHMLRTRNRPCERITFANCSLRSFCSAIRISYLHDASPVRSCVFSNLVIADSNMGIRIELRPKRTSLDPKTRKPRLRPDGTPCLSDKPPMSLVEDLVFSNIDMQRTGTPLTVTIGDRPWTACRTRGIRFTDVHARAADRLELLGGEGNPLEDFTFVNCSLRTQHPAKMRHCTGFRYDAGTFTLPPKPAN